MTIKKKLITFGVTSIMVVVIIVASMVAIFANNNMLVKTNIMIKYSGSMTNAYVTVNMWKERETTKTTVLAKTDASTITEEQVINNVTESLTENNSYFVIEYVVENTSASEYYMQLLYNDADADDSNITFKWYVSYNTQLKVENVMQQTFNESKLYWKSDPTQVIGNLELKANYTSYIYVVCGVDNLTQNAKFTGSLNWYASISPFAYTEQVGIFFEEGNYYVYMGEMPQSYVGTTLSNVSLSSEVYTENGVDYEVYKSNITNQKYVKRDGVYYKMEKIKWQVLGMYNSNSQSSSSSSYFSAYSTSNYTSKLSTRLVLIPTKILFKSQWNESLTRVDYPASTIYTRVLEFYNNTLSKYSALIKSQSIYYNDAVNYTQTSLTDTTATSTGRGTVTQNIWLFNTNQVNGWFDTAVKKQTYSTAWANGTTTEQLDSWWLRTNQYNVENEVEIFKANSVGVDGVLVGADITETKGVRPAMVVNLP